MPSSGLFHSYFKGAMDDRPAQFAARQDEVDSGTDAESSTLINVSTPSMTEDTVSVTLIDEDEKQQTQPLLKKGITTYYDEEMPISDSTVQDNESCDTLTPRQKFKRRFWKLKRRWRNSKDGESSCRKFFGRRCRREKRCKAKRVVIFMKLIAVLLLMIFFLSKFFRGSRHHPSPESDDHYNYDPAVGSSREIIVEKETGSIFGRYPLYDLLSLKTKTGSILVHIDPQPADPDHPEKPARLVLETTTGSISVSFSTPGVASVPVQEMDLDISNCFHDNGNGELIYENDEDSPCSRSFASSSSSSSPSTLPIRPYELFVQTHSGSIHGRLIYSSSAEIKTSRGAIELMIIPVVHPDLPSNTTLITESSVGSQRIHLSDPYSIPSSSSSSFHSSSSSDDDFPTAQHITDTGSLSLSYPKTWAGSVFASADGTGQICLEGRGLTVQKDGHGHATGRREPKGGNDDDDNSAEKWWGSTGKMQVNVTSRQSGSIYFIARSEGQGW